MGHQPAPLKESLGKDIIREYDDFTLFVAVDSCFVVLLDNGKVCRQSYLCFGLCLP